MGGVLEIEKILYPTGGVNNYAMLFGYNLPEITFIFKEV